MKSVKHNKEIIRRKIEDILCDVIRKPITVTLSQVVSMINNKDIELILHEKITQPNIL